MISYDEKVQQHFCCSEFVGELDVTEPDVFFGSAGTYGSGDMVQFYVRLDHHKIVEVKYKAHGSCATIAAANWMAKKIQNLSVEQVKKITWKEICDSLELPDVRKHSALLVIDALAKIHI